jgi:hypothetical protein
VKKLSILLLGVFLYASVMAQTITLRFDGANNTNNNAALRDYAVDIDGAKYYSADAEAVRSGVRQVVIENLALGSHKIMVYQANNNSISNADAPVYSNNFQLRSGYDMVIAVRRNGSVTFTEKRSTATGSTSTAAAMTETEFNKLAASVKAKWSQSSRITAVRSAFNTTSNYFTTDQAGQLLMLVSSETKRLELAKLSYPRITDPANFSDVADLFNSQANKENIALFIQSKDLEGTSTTTGAVTTQRFNQLLRQVRNQYRQEGKYAVLKDAFNVSTDYYTTAQLKQLLTLITAETDRLALAKMAYARVSDEANFASLYTLFNTQANRDEFNNYVRYGGSISSSSQYASRAAMSDADFSKLYNKARLHIRQSSVTADVKAAFSNTSNYFTVTQIRSLLTLLATESDKLSIAKLAYHRAADPTSFTQLYDMFTQASIDELNNYIRINPS